MEEQTYKVMKDPFGKDALEITTPRPVIKSVMTKQSIVDEIARLQELLAKFN